MHICGLCGVERKTLQGIRSHIAQAAGCRLAFREQVANTLARAAVHENCGGSEEGHHRRGDAPATITNQDADAGPFPANDDPMTGVEELPLPPVNPRRVTVEEVEDIEAGGLPKQPWVGEYLVDGTPVAAVLRNASTLFETLRDKRKAAGLSSFAPFDDREEWELAKWLTTSGLSQEAIDEYLTLPIVRQHHTFAVSV